MTGGAVGHPGDVLDVLGARAPAPRTPASSRRGRRRRGRSRDAGRAGADRSGAARTRSSGPLRGSIRPTKPTTGPPPCGHGGHGAARRDVELDRAVDDVGRAARAQPVGDRAWSRRARRRRATRSAARGRRCRGRAGPCGGRRSAGQQAAGDRAVEVDEVEVARPAGAPAGSCRDRARARRRAPARRARAARPGRPASSSGPAPGVVSVSSCPRASSRGASRSSPISAPPGWATAHTARIRTHVIVAGRAPIRGRSARRWCVALRRRC